MVAALLLIVLMAALIVASLLAAKYRDDGTEQVPPNAKAEDRVDEDHLGEPVPRRS